MPYVFKTYQNRPVVMNMSFRRKLDDYDVTIEFSNKPVSKTNQWSSFTSLPVQVNGNQLRVELSAEQVNTLKGAYFAIRAVGPDRDFYLDSGQLEFAEVPQKAEIRGDDLILIDAAGLEYNAGSVRGPQGDQGVPGTTTWAGITDKPDIPDEPGDIGAAPAEHTHDQYLTQEELDSQSTPNAVPGTIARRDDFNGITFNTVTVQETNDAWHAARKDYVDAKDEALGIRIDAASTGLGIRIGAAEATLAAATNANVANALVRRDQYGVFGGTYIYGDLPPRDPEHLTRKDYVDSANAALGTRIDAAQATLSAATSANTPGTLVRRGSAGESTFSYVAMDNAPADPWHLTRKDYVDTATAALGTRIDAAQAAITAATSNNTPNTIAKRDANGGFNVSWLYLNTPTASLGGTFAARKDYVDAIGTNLDTGDTVVRRTAGGQSDFKSIGITAASPTAVNHATRKDYVDNAVGGRVSRSGDSMSGDIYMPTPVSVKHTTSSQSQYFSGAAGASTIGMGPFKDLWHDIAAFNRHLGAPVFEQQTADGTWAAATRSDVIFSRREKYNTVVLDGTTIIGARWSWNNAANLRFSNVRWVVLGFAYSTPGSVSKTVLIESSADGTTWVTRHQSTHTQVGEPVWHAVQDIGGDAWFRVTITSSAGSSVRVNALRLMSYRWGDQGGSSEIESPIEWDNNRNIAIGHAWNYAPLEPLDVNGQIRIAATAPTSAFHATRKDYVDAIGTEAATANTVVRRDASSSAIFGRVYVNTTTGTSTAELTNKAYVDTYGASTPFAPSNQTGAITPDVSRPRTAIFTLTGNVTMSWGNGDGARSYSVIMILKQPATGGPFTVTWPSTLVWAGGAPAPTMPTAANSELIVNLFWTGQAWRAGVSGVFYP